MAGLLALMNMDDGARRVGEGVGLNCGEGSPAHHMGKMGNNTFREPLDRNLAEINLVSDQRSDRHSHGHVPWYTEKMVPDVGGLGWRTKTGHLLKNQAYYPQVSDNKWNNPTFAGVNTWKEYHGPRLRADAEIMGRLDQFDADSDTWEAKKEFVNTTRVQTLDRFYSMKHERSQLETSTSWAPHIRSKREAHSTFETFDSTMDQKPRKELKKVFTSQVLKGDRDAVRMITGRIQNEETWKQVWKQMEQERRSDLRADLQQRQAHTDRLMALSGQPVHHGASRSTQFTNSTRTHQLSEHRDSKTAEHVTARTDFRGLIHADNSHAMEALFPGAGHELSIEFRARATASVAPGWPPPPRPETPTMPKKGQSRELKERHEASLSHLSIPASTHKLDTIASRRNDVVMLDHSMVQFLPKVAAPAPDQSLSLLEEDYSPSATMRNGFRTTALRTTDSFARTSQCKLPNSPSAEHLPPPRRSVVYPMLAPTSPTSRKRIESNGMLNVEPTHLVSSASAPGLLGFSSTAAASTGFQRGGRARKPAKGPTTKSVCQELDSFEKVAMSSQVPNISCFTSTPRAASQPHSR